MTSEEEAISAAEKEVEIALDKLGRLLGAEGVMAEWTSVVAYQAYNEEGQGTTQIVRLFPDNVPYHRSLGLLDYASTRMRMNIGRLDNDDD